MPKDTGAHIDHNAVAFALVSGHRRQSLQRLAFVDLNSQSTGRLHDSAQVLVLAHPCYPFNMTLH